MKLEELNVYILAMELGEEIWNIVREWEEFPRKTIGQQLVRSSDSIAANISEGFGRFHFKENKNFLYYSRGSLCETKTWITKSHNRNLIEENIFKMLIEKLEKLGVKLNNYISSIGKTKTINDHK
jgi:four helix bundle protein